MCVPEGAVVPRPPVPHETCLTIHDCLLLVTFVCSRRGLCLVLLVGARRFRPPQDVFGSMSSRCERSFVARCALLRATVGVPFRPLIAVCVDAQANVFLDFSWSVLTKTTIYDAVFRSAFPECLWACREARRAAWCGRRERGTRPKQRTTNHDLTQVQLGLGTRK